MVFIDELDRCRPSYALALIEVAKHLFGADHVVFVLAVNRSQLTHSISALYGSDFDATGYLRRFFDIDFRLPEPDRTRFLEVMLNRMMFYGDGINPLKKIFGASDLSLRQLGKAIHHIGLTVASQNDRNISLITGVALVIRTIDSDLYWQFVRGNLSDRDLVDAMCERVSIKDEYFEAIIVMAAKEITSSGKNMMYDRQIESPLIDRYREEGGNSQTPGHAENVIKVVQVYERRGLFPIDKIGFGFLEAVRRIELLAGSYERS